MGIGSPRLHSQLACAAVALAAWFTLAQPARADVAATLSAAQAAAPVVEATATPAAVAAAAPVVAAAPAADARLAVRREAAPVREVLRNAARVATRPATTALRGAVAPSPALRSPLQRPLPSSPTAESPADARSVDTGRAARPVGARTFPRIVRAPARQPLVESAPVHLGVRVAPRAALERRPQRTPDLVTAGSANRHAASSAASAVDGSSTPPVAAFLGFAFPPPWALLAGRAVRHRLLHGTDSFLELEHPD